MSPIRGMTDPDSIVPRFPRLGKLKKGGEKIEKVKDGKKYTVMGPDLDHFRFTSDKPEIVEAFEEVYGKEPKSVMVYLPYATPEENFPTWCELWNATSLVHRCDGVNMVIWQENGKYITGSKPCNGGHKDNDPKKDSIGRLNVIIPELVQAGFVGYVTVETHSKNDIVSISQVLAEAFNKRGDNPLGLRGIQFVLRRVKENISVPGWGERADKRTRVDKFLVKLEPAVEWVRLQLDMDRKATMQLPSGEEREEVSLDDPSMDELQADPETGELIEDAPEGEFIEEPTTPEPPALSLYAYWPEHAKVSYALASTITDKDGKRYLDIDSQALSDKTIGISKMLADNHLSAAQKESANLKLDTIACILKACAAQAGQPALI